MPRRKGSNTTPPAGPAKPEHDPSPTWRPLVMSRWVAPDTPSTGPAEPDDPPPDDSPLSDSSWKKVDEELGRRIRGIGTQYVLWHAEGAILDWNDAPAALKRGFDDGALWAAWNASFDSTIWNYATLGFPFLEPERVIDPMIQAGVSNLPTDLEGAARTLGCGGKQANGKKLIRLFSIAGAAPADHPDEWRRFLDYAGRDVEAMREVYRRTRPLPRAEWRQYWAFERINRRGVHVDTPFVERAAALAAEDAAAIGRRLAELTDGAVTTVGQAKRIAAWLYDQLPDAAMREALTIGAPADEDEGDEAEELEFSLTRDRVARVLAMLEAKRANGGLRPDETKAFEAATLRLYGAGASPKKFARIAREQIGGVIRDQYRFAGAGQTGRASAKGIQVQNLTRDTLGDTEAALVDAIADGCTHAALAAADPGDMPATRKLALLVRPALIAGPGKAFVWSDWSAIEARVTPWLGAGKSTAALTAIAELIDDGHRRHALVIAPKLVAATVWPQEVTAWPHLRRLRVAVLDGGPAQRRKLILSAPARELTVIGVDLLPWLVDALAALPDGHALFDLLVIDETSRLKDAAGKRARALMRIAGRFRARWGLTGTPRPNSSLDLFMPVAIRTDGALWGRAFVPWRKRRFRPRDRSEREWTPLPGAEDAIAADLATVAMRVADEDMPHLPPLNVVVSRIELPPAVMATYKTMQRELFAAVEGRAIEAASAMIATGKCAQLANGFLYGDPKQMVECFGSLATRQFAIDGPRDRDSVYQFTDNASPATTPLGELPILPKAAYAEVCNQFDEIARAAGWTAVKERRRGGSDGATLRIFELDAGTAVDTDTLGEMTIAELERLVRGRRNAGALRCSGGFHDETRRRTDSHLINWGRYGLGVHDCMTGETWHRRERGPTARFEFLARLRERTEAA